MRVLSWRKKRADSGVSRKLAKAAFALTRGERCWASLLFSLLGRGFEGAFAVVIQARTAATWHSPHTESGSAPDASLKISARVAKCPWHQDALAQSP